MAQTKVRDRCLKGSVLIQIKTVGLKLLFRKTKQSGVAARKRKQPRACICKSVMTRTVSHDVELADGGLFLFAVLVKPLPVRGPGQDGAVLGLAAVRLRGPAVGRVPVFVRDSRAGVVYPSALLHRVADTDPHLLAGVDALADVVSELVILAAGRWRAKDTAQVAAVLAGSVVGFSHGVDQVALSVDLYAFQTDWKRQNVMCPINGVVFWTFCMS